jgi:glycosyltransferase involved in cell wall biosynthesis
MRYVLIITCDFPPQGGTGITRVTKFIKHLPEFGWQPVVLTTDRYGSLPTDDEQHVHRAGDLVHNLFSPLRRRKVQDVPPEAQYLVATIPTASFLGRLRDQVMVPDTKIGWLPGAVRLGRRLMRRYHPALLLSTSPPETAHLVAQQLRRTHDLPWAADLRDGWLYEPPQIALRQPRLRRTLEGALERQIITTADVVVTTTTPIGEDLCQRYPEAALKVRTITNGYDASDFARLSRRREADGRFLLVYTGALSAGAEGRSADAFFTALATFVHQYPATPLRVRFVGNVSRQEQAAALTLGLADFVEFIPPVSREQAHQYQRDADGLLLITAPGRRSEATSKLFEYIAAGVPILALAQGNAAAEIVQRYQLGATAPADDPSAIAAALTEFIAGQRAGTIGAGIAEAQSHFEWQTLTSQFASLFDELLASREHESPLPADHSTEES